MKTSATFRPHRMASLHALIIALLAAAASAQPLPTAFTYQGELKNGGAPAAGLHDFRFRIWSALTGGSTLGLAPVCVDNVSVTNGRFTARLDFGAAFSGQQRFLEVEVRQDTGSTCSDTTGYTVLSPRQELTVAPNAAYALKATDATNATNSTTAANATQLGGQAPTFYTNAANLTGSLPSASLAGSYAGAITLSNSSNSFSGSGAGLINLDATSLSTGTLADARLSTNIPRLDTGNAFGNTINSFMGLIGIGTTNPAHLLHISGTVPSIAIQDADSTTQQVGYVDFRDSTNTSQGWVGFGSPGDPDLSILNARAGGDLVVRSFTGAVQLTNQGGVAQLTSTGNFGIGTTTPGAKLDVRGDIRLGPTGNLRAIGAEENLRIIRGTVDSDGTIVRGSGFTAQLVDVGKFRITFNTPFSGIPTVTATGYRGFEATIVSVDNTIPISTQQVAFVTWSLFEDDFFSQRFEFIAIGPR